MTALALQGETYEVAPVDEPRFQGEMEATISACERQEWGVVSQELGSLRAWFVDTGSAQFTARIGHLVRERMASPRAAVSRMRGPAMVRRDVPPDVRSFTEVSDLPEAASIQMPVSRAILMRESEILDVHAVETVSELSLVWRDYWVDQGLPRQKVVGGYVVMSGDSALYWSESTLVRITCPSTSRDNDPPQIEPDLHEIVGELVG